MKVYVKGSLTVEATYILPLILFCICITVETAVLLHEEIRIQIEEQKKVEELDIITGMYRREYVKGLFGEKNED